MYSFNREGKTYGEVRVNLRGKEKLDSPAVRVNVPVDNAQEVLHCAVDNHKRVGFSGILNNGKRFLYRVLA